MASPAPRPPVVVYRPSAAPLWPEVRQPVATLEERMQRHAYDEARREVEGWFSHEVYQWRAFEG